MSPAVVILQKSPEMLGQMGQDLSKAGLVDKLDYVLAKTENEAYRFAGRSVLQMLVVGTDESDRAFAERMKARNPKLVVVSFRSLSTIHNTRQLSSFRNSVMRMMEAFTFERRRLAAA